jgi:hypothetical protein
MKPTAMPLKAKNLFFNAQEHDKSTSPALCWQKDVLTECDCKFLYIITLTSTEL